LSHTQTHHAFASLSEEGINDFVEAFFTARPHYLNYGSWPFVTAGPPASTLLAPLSLPPMIVNPIPFHIVLKIPVIDLFPASGPLPPPLVLHKMQFSAATQVLIEILCGNFNQDGKGGGVPIKLILDVTAIGHLVSSPGMVGFDVDAVEIVDIVPDALEEIFNCVLLNVMKSVLSHVSFPIPSLSGGFLPGLALEQGPELNPDEVDVWGNV
jgi:hypothetical protein